MNPDYVQSLQTSHHFPADLTYRLFPSELAYLIDDLYESTQLPLELIFKEGANKQVISSQADSLIKISRIWADFFPANTSNQPV
ncbi:hypothetical protein, partial [Escherichia coli]|uniref:hypothetical protein n=1 Tax=Escherichia coli TaxID=562 RepID=UPI0021B15ED7